MGEGMNACICRASCLFVVCDRNDALWGVCMNYACVNIIQPSVTARVSVVLASNCDYLYFSNVRLIMCTRPNIIAPYFYTSFVVLL